jgi:hypothetical protein
VSVSPNFLLQSLYVILLSQNGEYLYLRESDRGTDKLHNKECTLIDVQITDNNIGKSCSTRVMDKKFL